MSRKRINVRIEGAVRDYLQSFANNDATIQQVYDLYQEPECGELQESQYWFACSVCRLLCKELSIKGVPDQEYLETEKEYSELKKGNA